MYFAWIDINALPLKTDRTLRAVPYVTYGLCYLNIFIYLALLGNSNYAMNQIFLNWGFIIAKPSLLTLFTHAFLHGGLLHLLSNIFILWLMGTVLESGIGSTVFLLLYLASQVTAILLYAIIGSIFMPDSLHIPLVGASGAISGVTGLAAFRYYRMRVLTLPLVGFSWFPIIPVPILVWLPLWIYALIFAVREVIAGVQSIQGQGNSAVAHWAHVGGLALGMLMALITRVAQEGKRESVLEDSVKATAGELSKEHSRAEVQRLLTQQPNDPELLEAMAALTMVNGEKEQSRDYYIKSIRIFLASGQRDRAAVDYLNVLHAFPETIFTPREQVALASSLEGQRHFTDAAQAFLLIHEKYPTRDEAQTALLRAAQIYIRHCEDAFTAHRLLTTLLQQYPDSPWSNLARDRIKEVERALAARPRKD